MKPQFHYKEVHTISKENQAIWLRTEVTNEKINIEKHENSLFMGLGVEKPQKNKNMPKLGHIYLLSKKSKNNFFWRKT